MRKTGKSIFVVLLPLLITGFVSNAAPFICIPSLPDIADNLDLSKSQASNILSAYFLTLSLTYLIVGTIGNTWNKKRLLFLASFLIFGGSIVCALSDSLLPLVTGRIIQAMGAAIVIVTGQTWIGQKAESGNVTTMFSYLTIFLSFSPLIAPIIGGIVNDVFSWRYNFYIIAVLALFAGLLVSRTTPPPPEQSSGNVTMKSVLKSYMDILFRSHFLSLASASLICSVFQGALMSYSSFLLVDELKLTPALSGLISIPIVAGIITGQFPVMYFEKKQKILTSYLLNNIFIITALLFSIVWYMINKNHSVVEFTISIFVFNIGFGGHTLLSLRNIIPLFESKRSYSSALVNFTDDMASYFAAATVQILFLYIGSVMELHTVFSAITILLLILVYPSFKLSYNKVIRYRTE